MKKQHILTLIVTLSSSFVLLLIIMILFLICLCTRKWSTRKKEPSDDKEANNEEEYKQSGEFIKFEGGEELTCFDILDAPGEVIGKSSYGTLYRANLLNDSVLLLRFLRPACSVEKVQDVMHVVQLLGSVRHPNLVPLCGYYSGNKGEKLLVYPFYKGGNLAQFIRGEFFKKILFNIWFLDLHNFEKKMIFIFGFCLKILD